MQLHSYVTLALNGYQIFFTSLKIISKYIFETLICANKGTSIKFEYFKLLLNSDMSLPQGCGKTEYIDP